MKKSICIALAALFALLCFASCGAPKPTVNAASMVGMYESGDCAVTIEAKTDGVVFVYAIQGSGELHAATEWKFTASCEAQTNTLRYSDCVCTHVTFDEHGETTEEKVVYENGAGALQFAEDGSFTWESGQDADNFGGMTFVKLPAAGQ